VPLVVSFPPVLPQGRRVAAPVTLADLAATLVDLAGAEPIPGATARSFADLLAGGADDGREAFCELIGDMFLGRVGPSGAAARMLRRGSWKCNYYHGEGAELFNLGDDPGEMNDLAADGACRDVLEAMTARILDGWDPEHVGARAAALLALRNYTRPAPADPSVLAGEHWQAPKDYGYVDPV
jgi:choline-sulfatase